MDRQKIILDCDPGHDDAIAIMIAGKAKNLELLAITVVAGNQTIEKTTKNALNVCQYLGLDLPVYSGCHGPMVRQKQVIADEIHGETGLDGPVFEKLEKEAETEHAVDYLIKTLMKSEGDIILAATGPLTNLAMAMRLQPDIIPKIKEIVLMGGSYQLGNVTPAARLFGDLMTFFNQSQKKVFGWEGGPLHDPVTIAYLMDSSLLTKKAMHTTIDIKSEQSYGRTNCDYFCLQDAESNCEVAVDIDVERFWDLVEQGIKNYET